MCDLFFCCCSNNNDEKRIADKYNALLNQIRITEILRDIESSFNRTPQSNLANNEDATDLSARETISISFEDMSTKLKKHGLLPGDTFEMLHYLFLNKDVFKKSGAALTQYIIAHACQTFGTYKDLTRELSRTAQVTLLTENELTDELSEKLYKFASDFHASYLISTDIATTRPTLRKIFSYITTQTHVENAAQKKAPISTEMKRMG